MSSESVQSGILYTLGPLPSFSLLGTPLPMYFFWISLVTCLCIFGLYRRTERQGVDSTLALDTTLVALITGFIGARLFHVVFERPEVYLENPWMVLEVWRGGFVFYGGLLFGYAGGLLFVRIRDKENLLAWHDIFAPVISAGYALGRVACFLQGCCYGKVCDLPWATPLTEVHAHSQRLSMRHPTALYAVAWEIMIFGCLIYIEAASKKKNDIGAPRPGRLFFLWLGLHSLGRILMEFFRDDPRGLEPFGLMSLSTFISFGLILVASLLFFKTRK